MEYETMEKWSLDILLNILFCVPRKGKGHFWVDCPFKILNISVIDTTEKPWQR